MLPSSSVDACLYVPVVPQSVSDKRSYELGVADRRDLNRLEEMMVAVELEISDIDVFRSDDRAYLERHLGQEGYTLKAVCDGVLAAFMLVRFPGDAPDNMERSIRTGTPLDDVVHMESVVVSPEFRGMGMQRALIHEAVGRSREDGYTLATATVSPRNPPSLRNFEAEGFTIHGTYPKYGSVRHILVKWL